MDGNNLRNAVGRLRRAVRPVRADGLSDTELLVRWVAARDEAAFETLVWRHGPMVLGVCRRLLHDAHEAEDAFQATFLALARKDGNVGNRGAVAGWLYRVAYRTALHARGKANHRPRSDASALAAAPARPAEDPAWRDLKPVLDEEVSRLPEPYRLAFVLCHLQGRSNEEAARVLGCPVGTVLSRLARARGRLRDRLTRRGLAPTVAAMATAASADTLSAAVSHALAASTAGQAPAFVMKQGASLLPGTDHAAALAEGVLRGMTMTKWKIAAALLFTVGLLGTGVGALAYRQQGGEQTVRQEKPARPPQEGGNAEARQAPKEAAAAALVEAPEDNRAALRERAVKERQIAEREYEELEEKWSSDMVKLRLCLTDFEERFRALERAQSAMREREMARIKTAEAAFDKQPGDGTRARLAELEALSRERDGQRLRATVDARLGLVQAEETLRRAEREQAVRRSLALARLEEAADRVRRMEAEGGAAEKRPARADELALRVEALTREVKELRRAVERLRPKER